MEGSHVEIKQRLAEQSEALRAARAAAECGERRLREARFEWQSTEAALTEARRHAEQAVAQLQARTVSTMMHVCVLVCVRACACVCACVCVCVRALTHIRMHIDIPADIAVYAQQQTSSIMPRA